MTKYSALSHYLSQVKEDFIQLNFAQIEQIIGSPLPRSAKRHLAWWSNETKGTHKWAHLWLAAGWAKDRVDMPQHLVSFRRNKPAIEDLRDELCPQTLETIFDLLQLAGISTVAWLEKANGETVASVKANPNFCYNWSFGSPREGFALCIWWDSLTVEGGKIVFSANLRDHAERLYRDGNNSLNDEARKHRSLTQSARAYAFDDALGISYDRGMPLSVIITEGDMRTRDESGEGASHVQYRSLDPVKWYVHKYNRSNGESLLVRGIRPEGVMGETMDTMEEDWTRPDDVQQRAIKIRRGQPKFRETVLSAYRRTCAITGCIIVELLEAAHIRPHAEEPNYHVSNGILLRADIHTLFDIGLLAIDTHLRVQLAPELLSSEYKCYHNINMTHPEYPSQMPKLEALERRYAEFKNRHKR